MLNIINDAALFKFAPSEKKPVPKVVNISPRFISLINSLVL